MNEHFKLIVEALIREGFPSLAGEDQSRSKPLDFKITPYSLNTTLSFKFDNLDHFVEFLKLHDSDIDEKIAALQVTMMELGLNPNEFFWVNFFEKGKEQEM
jgi:hypothetical protein